MLKRRRIASQVLSSVTYYLKWPTLRGTGGPHRVESLPRLKRNPHYAWALGRALALPSRRGFHPTRGGASAGFPESVRPGTAGGPAHVPDGLPDGGRSPG
ncbi:hypothetical protein DFAR_3480012 [Desulfarculales bacterium]